MDYEKNLNIFLEVIKTISAASLVFLAGFLAFTSAANPKPALDWSVWICVLSFVASSICSLCSMMLAGLLLINDQDVLSNNLFTGLVLVGVATFSAGTLTGSICVIYWFTYQ